MISTSMMIRVFFISVLGIYLQSFDVWACDPDKEDCRFRFPVQGSHVQYFSNRELTEGSTSVTRLIIGIQGNKRNPARVFKTLYDMTKGEEKLSATVILVPWLKANDSIIDPECGQKKRDPIDENEIYWSYRGWKQGDNSLSTEKLSSFKLIDDLITSVIQSNRFPNLRSIAITGHSAGAQFTHRYAIGTSIERTLPAAISMTYVLANPSSYLYLDSNRPTWAGLYRNGGVYPAFGLNASRITGPEFSDPYIRTQSPFSRSPIFGAISPGINSSSGSTCNCTRFPCNYEKFKFGFNFKPKEPTHYMSFITAHQKTSSNSVTDRVKFESYLKKNVVYLLGQLDNSTNEAPKGTNDELDTTCAGNYQGPDRLTRGTYYYEYLSRFGSHEHRLLILAGVGHDTPQVYSNYKTRQAIFGGELPVKEYLAPLYQLMERTSSRPSTLGGRPASASKGKSVNSLKQLNWILTRVGPDEYRIVDKKTFHYLNFSSEASGSVNLAPYRDSASQVWIIKPTANEPSLYTIQQKRNESFLASNPANGGLQVSLQPGVSTAIQWMIEAI